MVVVVPVLAVEALYHEFVAFTFRLALLAMAVNVEKVIVVNVPIIRVIFFFASCQS